MAAGAGGRAPTTAGRDGVGGGIAGEGGTDDDGGSAGAPSPAECVERLAGLGRSCETDGDCALATFNRCSVSATGEILGLAATELAAFEEVKTLCRAPVVASDCPAGDGGGLSRTITEDGVTLPAPGLTAEARCVAQRCESFAATCGKSLCGNGTIDSCEERMSSEQCDGDVFDAITCATRGFAGGTPACSDDACTVDLSGCSVCPNDDPSLLCRTNHESPVDWLVSAGSDDELALIYSRDGSVRFARYSPELTLLSDEPVPNADPGDVAALARGPHGWLAAIATPGDGYVLLSAEAGSGAFVTAGGERGEGRDPFFVVRPGAQPVLGLSINEAACRLTSFDDELAPEGAVTDPNGGCQAGAPVSNGFLVAYTDDFRAAVASVSADLSSFTRLEPFPLVTPSGSERVLIEPSGGGAVLVHDVWAEGAAWIYRLGSDGVALGEPLNAFVGRMNVSRPGRFVPFDGGLFLPVEAASGGGYPAVHLYAIDATGAVTADRLVASPATRPNAVRVGSGIVVTFFTDDGFGLARYLPEN